MNLASALELANNLEEAGVAAGNALAVAPDSPQAALIAARIQRRKKRPDVALEVLQPALEGVGNLSDRIQAYHEHGLILDLLGRYEEAFEAFSRSNVLRKGSPETAPCDPRRYLSRVRAYRRWAEQRAGRAPDGSGPGAAPVFFVGFPRSGTTLVEQALMTHPDIVTTEEESPLRPVEAALRRRFGPDFPNAMDGLAEPEREALRAVFDEAAADIVGERACRVLVDKLPLNIVALGLVETLWPNARVLVALRDPRDACLNCFIQQFSLNDAMANFLDIKATAETYAEVMGLWLRYREVLSLPVLEYRYEDLVSDFDGTVRRILDFVGVGWDDAVAGYREAAKERTIRTPSYREVTGVVHKRAVARWRGYAEDLAPVLPVLAPFAQAFGYDGAGAAGGAEAGHG